MVSNRLTKLLAERSEQSGRSGRLLAVYTSAGYPRLDALLPIGEALSKAGVDIIEVGMPFSDPLADGPTIQQSSEDALKNGINLPLILQQVRELRSRIETPILLMGYINPVIQYGVEKFCKDAAQAGVDGLIIPDLPLLEYQQWMKAAMAANNLSVVFLVCADTPDARVQLLDQETTGFLYAVSTPSITGGQSDLSAAKMEHLERLKGLALKNAVMVGFGIHDRASFDLACNYGSGAIVGSAFIRAVGNPQIKDEQFAEVVEKFIKSVRE